MATIRNVVKKEYTGAAAIAIACPIPATRKLVSVTAHFSGDPGAETLTVTLDANAGAVYDTVLLSQSVDGVTDVLWQPDSELILESGDYIDIAMTNAGTVTYGIQITTAEVQQ